MKNFLSKVSFIFFFFLLITRLEGTYIMPVLLSSLHSSSLAQININSNLMHFLCSLFYKQEARTNYRKFRDLIWHLVYKQNYNELEKVR